MAELHSPSFSGCVILKKILMITANFHPHLSTQHSLISVPPQCGKDNGKILQRERWSYRDLVKELRVQLERKPAWQWNGMGLCLWQRHMGLWKQMAQAQPLHNYIKLFLLVVAMPSMPSTVLSCDMCLVNVRRFNDQIFIHFISMRFSLIFK